MTVKINSLEVENVKRVKAVKVEPSVDGLTVIGGKNNQGKTTVLDAIAWALGGGKFRPSEPAREGSVTPPQLRISLSNGLIVERKGKNSDLKVMDPEGGKSGQALLDGFVSELALNLPKFMAMTDKEKATTLLNIIGVGDQLYTLENQEQTLYNQRHGLGQMAEQKKSAAAEMTTFPDAPAEPVSAAELIQKQQTILAKNGENQQKRAKAGQLAEKQTVLTEEVRQLSLQLAEKKAELEQVSSDLITSAKTVQELQDESTAEIEQSISDIDAINEKVRTNQKKATAEAEAEELKSQYDDMSEQLEEVRKKKMALLDGANLPLEGLSIEEGQLTYNGHQWDGMSGSDQLKVATAIVRKLNPECGFVLVDKLEQMDTDTLAAFGTWAETQGLQIIATRVSTGPECEIIIEDGYSSNVNETSKNVSNTASNVNESSVYVDEPTISPSWKAGEF